MAKFAPPLKRINRGKNHWYVDGKGVKIPGVTSILSNGMPKPALVGWGMRTTAEYAVNHWDDLGQLPIAKRLEILKGAAYADRDAAARQGTRVHNLAEKLVKGEKVTVPDDLAGHVESYMEFLRVWDPIEHHVEASVVSWRHGYAGTLDLIAEIPGYDGLSILDIKTSRSGIFGETALQLAAYAHADEIVADGAVYAMPEISHGFAIHVRSDGYDLRQLPVDDAMFLRFRYVAEVAKTAEFLKDIVGDALEPPIGDNE